MTAALRAYTPPLLYAGLLLLVGSLPHTPAIRTALPLDKLAHLLMYGLLGWLIAGAWLRAGRRPAFVLPFAVAVALAGADELHQRSVAGRSAEVADFVADVVGLGTASAVRLRWSRRARRG